MRGKELELEQAAEAYRNIQWLKHQSEEKERSTLREKDAIINQLQGVLHARSQEIQVSTLTRRPHMLLMINLWELVAVFYVFCRIYQQSSLLKSRLPRLRLLKS